MDHVHGGEHGPWSVNMEHERGSRFNSCGLAVVVKSEVV